MTAHVPLKFGLLADVVTEATDRVPYVVPPVARGEHHEACACKECGFARLARKGKP